MFLDDMDKFANEDNQHPDAEEYVAVQACIDSCKDSDVFVFATANDKWCLPDSLLRSGRFDKVIELECPKGDNAVKVIQYYLSQKTNLGDADAIEIARIMKGHSCADLETVVNEAGIYAGYDGRDKIGRQNLLRACMRMLYEGPEYVEDKEDWDSKFRAVHEAGHAVASEVLEPGSVSLLSISGYSGECGGFTIVYTSVDYRKSAERMEQYMIHWQQKRQRNWCLVWWM